MICYVLLAGYPPFDGETDKDIEKAILKGDFSFKGKVWRVVSDDAMDFIEYLLKYDPRKRPTAREALQHPWLTKSREHQAGELKRRATDTTKAYLVCLQIYFLENDAVAHCHLVF